MDWYSWCTSCLDWLSKGYWVQKPLRVVDFFGLHWKLQNQDYYCSHHQSLLRHFHHLFCYLCPLFLQQWLLLHQSSSHFHWLRKQQKIIMTVRVNQSCRILPCKGLHNQGHIGFVDVVVDKVLLASVMGQPTRAFISARLTAARVFLNQYITLLTSSGLRPRRDSKAFNSRTYSSTYLR